MEYSVYITQNLLEPAKAYVGMTNGNKKNYMGSDGVLIADIKRLGKENFTKSILATFSDDIECHFWEGFYVKSMHTHMSEGGYNKTFTGGTYRIMSADAIIKRSKDRIFSSEAKANMSIAQKGRKWSDETRAKMSGIKLSEEAKTKISIARKGRKASDEAKANMSIARKGLKYQKRK